MSELIFSVPHLEDGAKFPLEYTGRGEDVSPEFLLTNLDPAAKTLAITLDDMSLSRDGFSHWVIWNLPAASHIPGAIPAGEVLPELGDAVQGIGYGRHRYAGPKPPRGTHHEYRFSVYTLDTALNLPPNARRDDFLQAAQGHVLQSGTLTGIFE